MSPIPIVSLVFVNYRSVKCLQESLSSLFRLEREYATQFEVIIANNDPAESGSLMALRNDYPVRVLESDVNMGFGQACNWGAQEARGSILGFINPDTVWTGGCLAEIVQVFSDNDKVGVVGMRLIDEAGRPEAWSCGTFPSLFGLILNNIVPFLRKRGVVGARPVACDWVSGAALFIRREVFERIGGFDPRFFLYFEDVALCREAKAAGYAVWLHPKFSIVHKGGMSQMSHVIQKRHFFASQEAYFRKYHHFLSRTLVSFGRFGSDRE